MPLKEKMAFFSSKETLRRAVVGISLEMQATEYSDISYEEGVFFLPCEFDLSCISPANTGRKVAEKLAK